MVKVLETWGDRLLSRVAPKMHAAADSCWWETCPGPCANKRYCCLSGTGQIYCYNSCSGQRPLC